MTIEEFKAKAKEVIDKEQFGSLGVLFDYESFEEMKVAQIPDSLDSATSDMPLDDFLDKLYEQIKPDSVLGKIKAEIEALPKTYPFVNHFDMYVKVSDVTKIIDKYKEGNG